MKRGLLIGKPNSGKTSFFIAFASYLGISKLDLSLKNYNGTMTKKSVSIPLAKKYLVSDTPYNTKEIIEISLSVPVCKGNKAFIFQDSSGITDGINSEEGIRRSMTLTLEALQNADLIFHMMDASSIYKKNISTISKIDDQINQYGRGKGCYCILASKTDLLDGENGFNLLKNKYIDSYVIPISTVNGRGFKEVKDFVGRNI